MREAPIRKLDQVLLPALSLELEAQRSPEYLHVAVAQRGQPERFVLLRILHIADAHERRLQQPCHRSQHLLAGQAGALQVFLYAVSDDRQHRAEGDHAAEFGAVPDLAIEGVIAVLLATLGIPADRLNVSKLTGTDPHVGPGRRDHQRADTFQLPLVAYGLPIGCEITEAVTTADTPYAGFGAIDVA